jgi:hypothetical protein
MRWDRLFEDLELQLRAAVDDQLDAEIAARTRSEVAGTSMEGRLRASEGRHIELVVAGAGTLGGRVRRVGAGWVLLDVAGGPAAVVAAHHVVGARNLPVAAREAAGGSADIERGLAPVLRVLCRDRSATGLVLAAGTAFSGTIDRVGSDYLDLAEHPLDEPRRWSAVSAVRTVPLAAVAVLRPRLE